MEKLAFLSLLSFMLSCPRWSLWSQPNRVGYGDPDPFHTHTASASLGQLAWAAPSASPGLQQEAPASSLIQPHVAAAGTVQEPGARRSVPLQDQPKEGDGV